mmetsp:Transcript_11947/g.35401  ORF Transcript_11947/g.35401 Transcript_11947/m.35401 type:complete len:387 (+) Transcript_11947:5566-6726(+)
MLSLLLLRVLLLGVGRDLDQLDARHGPQSRVGGGLGGGVLLARNHPVSPWRCVVGARGLLRHRNRLHECLEDLLRRRLHADVFDTHLDRGRLGGHQRADQEKASHVVLNLPAAQGHDGGVPAHLLPLRSRMLRASLRQADPPEALRRQILVALLDDVDVGVVDALRPLELVRPRRAALHPGDVALLCSSHQGRVVLVADGESHDPELVDGGRERQQRAVLAEARHAVGAPPLRDGQRAARDLEDDLDILAGVLLEVEAAVDADAERGLRVGGPAFLEEGPGHLGAHAEADRQAPAVGTGLPGRPLGHPQSLIRVRGVVGAAVEVVPGRLVRIDLVDGRLADLDVVAVSDDGGVVEELDLCLPGAAVRFDADCLTPLHVVDLVPHRG